MDLKALILVTVLPCSWLAQSPPDEGPQIETHLQKAREFLKNNQTDAAGLEFKAVLALDPNNVDARNNLGVLLFFRGDYAQAVQQLRVAVKLQPILAKTQDLLGCAKSEPTAYRIYSTQTDETMLSIAMSAPGSARLRQGNSEGAIAHYREAIKIDPHLSGAHFELAEC